MNSHWQIKAAISTLALAAAAVAVFQDRLGLTISGTVAALIALAVVPWLSPLLQSAELPGGWKLEFRKVEEEQIRQRAELDALRFLVSGFVTGDELTHLRKLADETPFPFIRGPETEYFFGELRRLRSLGLIRAREKHKGLRALGRDGGDINAYFRISARGREYLRLRTEVEGQRSSPESSPENS